jgi:hypothetical protein
MQIEPHEVICQVNKWIQANKFDVTRDKKNVELSEE